MTRRRSVQPRHDELQNGGFSNTMSTLCNHRRFLGLAAHACAGVALTCWASALRAAPAQVAAGADGVTVIDTHTHFYNPNRPEGVPWPPREDKLLYRPVLPK